MAMFSYTRANRAANKKWKLRIDAADGFPKDGNRFAGFNLHAGFGREFFETEIRFEAEAVAERGI